MWPSEPHPLDDPRQESPSQVARQRQDWAGTWDSACKVAPRCQLPLHLRKAPSVSQPPALRSWGPGDAASPACVSAPPPPATARASAEGRRRPAGARTEGAGARRTRLVWVGSLRPKLHGCVTATRVPTPRRGPQSGPGGEGHTSTPRGGRPGTPTKLEYYASPGN